MISFISRFKLFLIVIFLIVCTETAIAVCGMGSHVYINNFLEFAYRKRVSPQKFVILKKLEELAGREADLISVGDSTGLFGLQPDILDSYLEGKKYINFSTAGDAGYEGYRYMGEYYLRKHKKGKVLLATLTPYTLPADYMGTSMARSIRDNFINHWRYIVLPSFSWRLKLTNWLYYDKMSDKPFELDTSDGSYPPLVDWETEIPDNRGWLEFPFRVRVSREDCDFRNQKDDYGKHYDKSFVPELEKFVSLAREYDSPAVLLFSPVSCVDAGYYSDYVQIELDRFAFKHRDVFIPFGIIDTWPLENFGDRMHLKPKPSERYSHIVGHVLSEWLKGSGRNYYGNSFESMHSNKLDGEVKTYFNTGEVKTVRTYKEGKPEGAAKTFYRDGTLRAVRSYNHGVLEGEVQSFFPGGQLEYSTYFKNGKRSGRSTRYFANGNVRKITDYVNDLENGMVIFFNQNGRKEMEFTMVDGEANGIGIQYYPDGRYMKANYRMDMMEGTVELYDPAGNLLGTKEISKGKQVS